MFNLILRIPAIFITILKNLLSYETILIQNGTLFAKFNLNQHYENLLDYEFKVFSQFGEDGILQYLTSEVSIPNKTLIEFGVENYSESNTRFLVQKDNWSAFVIDGSPKKIKSLVKANYFWRHDIKAIDAFITSENIDSLLNQSGFPRDLGILSIDLDGNDYWVYKSISKFDPRIVIVEYNSVFGNKLPITIPYDTKFQRTKAHFSNLYFGVSLPAWIQILTKKGYVFVGSNSSGHNAFFVRQELMTNELWAISQNAKYIDSKFRESRSPKGKLTYLAGIDRSNLIGHLPVVNVETDEVMPLNNALY
jgi:hypothetical protein